MDALEFFALRYDNLHGPFTAQLLDGLTDDQLRQRPHGVNSIAWLLCHLARCEDVGVIRLVADRPQVVDDEGWLTRLGVPRRDIGTGMTGDEVDELSERVDLGALRAYWDAIYRRTQEVLRGLDPADLTRPVDPGHIHRVSVEEGALGPTAGWAEPIWPGRPNRGWFLAQLPLAPH